MSHGIVLVSTPRPPWLLLPSQAEGFATIEGADAFQKPHKSWPPSPGKDSILICIILDPSAQKEDFSSLEFRHTVAPSDASHLAGIG